MENGLNVIQNALQEMNGDSEKNYDTNIVKSDKFQRKYYILFQ
jgi:hypothetical protein